MPPHTIDTITVTDPVTDTEQTVTVSNHDDWIPGDGCPECGHDTMAVTELTSEVASTERGLVQTGNSRERVEVQCTGCDTILRQHPMIAVFRALPNEHWETVPDVSHIGIVIDDTQTRLAYETHPDWSSSDNCPVCGESVFYEVHLDTSFGRFDDESFQINAGGDRLATLHRSCDVCDTLLSQHPLLELYTELDTTQ